MKVALYCRVSTEEQNVKQQLDYLTKYALAKGFEVVKRIGDTESGSLPLHERKAFKKLLEQYTDYDALVVYNLDRLTRNWDDVTLIEKHFREHWSICKLISASDSIDLSIASGRLMFRIKMAIQCYMPEDMREKQRIGIERAKLEGKYKGGKPGRTWE